MKIPMSFTRKFLGVIHDVTLGNLKDYPKLLAILFYPLLYFLWWSCISGIVYQLQDETESGLVARKHEFGRLMRWWEEEGKFETDKWN